MKTELQRSYAEILKVISGLLKSACSLIIHLFICTSTKYDILLQLREFDQELSRFGDRLAEFPITFPPSYPFEEGAKGEGSHYMQTRCPSWCDRVILDKAAKKLVDSVRV